MRRIDARHAAHSRAQGDLLQWLAHLAKVPRAHGAIPRQAHQAAETPNVSFQSPLLLTHTLSLNSSLFLSHVQPLPTLSPSLYPLSCCLSVCRYVCPSVFCPSCPSVCLPSLGRLRKMTGFQPQVCEISNTCVSAPVGMLGADDLDANNRVYMATARQRRPCDRSCARPQVPHNDLPHARAPYEAARAVWMGT